jgi:hypothetical protein
MIGEEQGWVIAIRGAREEKKKLVLQYHQQQKQKQKQKQKHTPSPAGIFAATADLFPFQGSLLLLFDDQQRRW